AVKRFQQQYGIDQTGLAGPKTRAKLNQLYATPATVTLTPAARQALIAQLQAQLKVLLARLVELLRRVRG
ncbi:MAG: peptidoglycan-binding protein, partial [Candidatus Vogelbacteria bacterium]|nr:peptidoglycan-binding protein [Candidatus Vogelbacteria bacterium]